MKIAVDLTALADNFSGIERYAASLAIELLNDSDLQFVLVFKDKVHSWFSGRIGSEGVEFVVIPRGNVSKLLFSQFVLPRVLSRIDADIFLFLAFPAPFFFRGVSISTLHDLTFIDYPETMTLKSRVFYRVMGYKATRAHRKVVTISEFSKSRILEHYGISENYISVVYCGVDATRFNSMNASIDRQRIVSDKYGLPEHFVLSLSTLEPRKNLPMLIKAWGKLRADELINCDLVLAGRKGWKIDTLLAECPNEVVKHVHFIGFVDEEDLPALYAISDLFVFPSLYEGFGLPPVEAVFCGANVLCSDIPCLHEICGDAVAYFDVKCEVDLKRAMLEGLAAKNNADEPILPRRYSWAVEAQKLRIFLESQ